MILIMIAFLEFETNFIISCSILKFRSSMLQLMMLIMIAFLEFELWEQQEQLLLAWLQSTISRDMPCRVIGCKSLWILWVKSHTYFQQHTAAKLCQLRSELRHVKLKNCKNSISELLRKVSAISTEVKTLLLCHESQPDRFCKNTIAYANANLTALSAASNDIPHFTASNPNSSDETYSANLQGFGSRGVNLVSYKAPLGIHLSSHVMFESRDMKHKIYPKPSSWTV
ncbi:unnamed protein product [Vicia faba]|uniref:Uncharacterized protein n=1 Tax=Vicia faba TaxID=3906 RepID=A0AAV0YZ86_VICFA|nr:unnamed protein product [Vicia faba]